MASMIKTMIYEENKIYNLKKKKAIMSNQGRTNKNLKDLGKPAHCYRHSIKVQDELSQSSFIFLILFIVIFFFFVK